MGTLIHSRQKKKEKRNPNKIHFEKE